MIFKKVTLNIYYCLKTWILQIAKQQVVAISE